MWQEIKLSQNELLIKKEICNHFNLLPAIADVLIQKGYNSIEKVQAFLDFNEATIPDALLMPDMQSAVNRISQAIILDEKAVVYADTDCDGASAGAIVVNCLKNLGLNVNYFTNDRFKEGFGMKVAGVKRLLAEFPDTQLIITVDNGVVAFDATDYLNSLGIDVIITDHHEPDLSGCIPNAIAVVDNKRADSRYPFKDLCGAGVAYRLMQEVYKKNGYDMKVVLNQLPIVALATVADCVPLVDENRYYVKEGIRLMGQPNQIVFNVLCELMKVQEPNEETFGFYIGPMINSSARLTGNALIPIKLLTSNNYDEIYSLANKLIQLNESRKLKTTEQSIIADEIIQSKNLDAYPLIMISDSRFDEGIVGIIAGRITEMYKKPAIVFTNHNSNIKGSARSVENFNIKEAFDALEENIISYGGHSMAAGIEIDPNNFDKLYQKLNYLANKVVVNNFSNDIIVNTSISPSELNIQFVDQYNQILRPFGIGFEPINLALKNFNVDETRVLKDVHLKLSNCFCSVLWFNTGAEEYKNLNSPKKIDILGTPGINVFKGNVSYQFLVNKDKNSVRESI